MLTADYACNGCLQSPLFAMPLGVHPMLGCLCPVLTLLLAAVAVCTNAMIMFKTTVRKEGWVSESPQATHIHIAWYSWQA